MLLPLGISLVVLAGDRDLGSWRRFAPWAGPALFVAIIGAWIVLATVGGGREYSVWSALKEHFIERGIRGYHHKQPPWYFLQVLPATLMPWTFIVPGAMVLAWRRRLPADRLHLTAACFVVLFFSISTEKRELYALPALPALAPMVAGLVAAVSGWSEPRTGEPVAIDRRWLVVGQGILGAVLLAIGLFSPSARSRAPFVPAWMVYVLGAVLLVTGVATLYYGWRRQALRSVLAPAVGLAVVYLFAVSLVLPTFEVIKSARPFALVIKDETRTARAAGLPVLCYRLGNLPEHFAYYSDGVYTVETDDLEVLEEHLRRSERVYAVVDADRLEGLAPEVLDRLERISSTSLASRSVALVANRQADTAAAD